MGVVRKQIRGDELVARILRATLAEVGRVGVEHLSIEDVAELAGVNKTTIYRRWPSPDDLARAALACAADSESTPPDTGTLRGDLRAFARGFRRIASLPEMKTVMRLRWSGDAKGRLASLTRDLQDKKHAQWRLMLRRAVSRGELSRSADLNLIQDLVLGALIYLVVIGPRRSSLERLDRAIDMILDGALSAASGRDR
jgi:AcrR family transcriptional regulator